MDKALLNPEVQRFIIGSTNAGVQKIALSKNPFPDIAFPDILNQIAARGKASEKLPTWFKTPNILYPPKISLEQTSSEATAEYKSKIVTGTLIDLTGGFGVDAFYFSKIADAVFHCEMNVELSEIAAHNLELLGAGIKCIAGDGASILRELNTNFDWIYIDPSRRNDSKGKVFMLADCTPNVPELIDFYFLHAKNVLVKTAPLLDITAGLQELKYVKKIHVVAVKNEVKELLWELEKEYSGPVQLLTRNIIGSNTNSFDFFIGDQTEPKLGVPANYLYEPNAAIMKSGGFNEITVQFPVLKLHRHSHLYTSEELIDFPGRRFKIDRVGPYNKETLQRIVKANLTVRNFPHSPEYIRKKHKIADGGDTYCFFTTDRNDVKIVLICSKI